MWRAGQLVLNKKNWFGQKDEVLHESEGAITAIAWLNSLVAWSNDRGVKIMDTETQERITFVERPASAQDGDERPASSAAANGCSCPFRTRFRSRSRSLFLFHAALSAVSVRSTRITTWYDDRVETGP